MQTKSLMKGLVAAAGVLAAGAAFAAGVTNTKHDMGQMGKTTSSIVARGVCSYCHVPHGASGSRLWAGTIPAASYATPVAQLCASCHAVEGIIVGWHESGNMFEAGTHGYDLTVATAGSKLAEGWNVPSSGLPYVDGITNNNRIDCSSCHNPHTGDRRTFLQADHPSFCQRCHTLRDMNVANALFTNTNGSGFSTHPSGAAQTGLGRTATAPINWMTHYRAPFATQTAWNITQLGTNLLTGTAATLYRNSSWWVLGGHRNDGSSGTAPTASVGGVVCMTCHVVHGTDPNTAVLGTYGLTDRNPKGGVVLLNDPVAAVVGTTTVTNPRDNLCIDCHGLKVGGAGRGTHPVAGTDGTYTGEVSTTPLDMLAGFFTGANAIAPSASLTYNTGSGEGITCLTCHDTHLGKNNSPIFVNSNLYSGDLAQTYCQACHLYDSAAHTGIIPNGRHHPSTGSTNYDTATYMARMVSNSTFDSALGCNTCHAAHNTIEQGFGTSIIGQFALRAPNYTTTGTAGQPTSMICVFCHSLNPGRFRYNVDSAASATTYEYGTHWVAPAGSMSATTTSGMPASWTVASNGYDVGLNLAIQNNGDNSGTQPPQKLTRWNPSGAQYTGAGGFSKYGNRYFSWTTGVATRGGGVICESCHSVSMPRFAGVAPNNRSFLLLGQFLNTYNGTAPATFDRLSTDNTGLYADAGTTATAAGGDGLCLGCHGIPKGTHPTTGSTIGRRGGATLTTSAAVASYILNDPVGSELFYPGGNTDPGMMTCASCHDVHSGVTGGSYYILKEGLLSSGTYKAPGSAGTESVNYGVSGSTAATPTRHYAGLDFTDFCAACHSGYK